ncbi:DUF4097 family beta strand repeat-containing protein [Sphaerisporangium rubeum]|uniref:DUF4097 domain-containing protein n=1 Tax=Sphaerisporangium rubeum TaxID=321317 RepID=A0A7X0M7T9_9ACTN|nr:DUF4097 family beta strand repeat-containing protein [Sphaerisporangium rubeum]MBB6474905.1 hypothetical protein [Sphaerisporangium rubeum]
MPNFDTPEPITAEIDIYGGQVRINASDRADTVVEVRPSNPSGEASVQAAERTIVEFSNGRLLVKGPKPSALGYLLPWRGSVDVTVDLPTGSGVRAEGPADFVGTGTLGEVRLNCPHGDLNFEETGPIRAKASNGDISVDRVAGTVEVNTSNGTIRLGTLDGGGLVKSSNGDIVVGEVTGDVEVRTAHGDVTVGRALAGLTARTAYGRIRVGAVVRGTVRLENGYGKVGVGIAEGTAAWLDLRSKNGVVRNNLTPSDGPGTSDAVVEVHVQTNWGDIDVHRS